LSDPHQPVTQAAAPVRLAFTARAGADLSKFLRGLTERRIVGRRCDTCHKVYVPPRGACPTCGTRMGGEVELSQHGTVTTFCVVNIPFEGQRLKPPYACASVLLDGADIGLFHLVGNCEVKDVRMGMRVKAVWVDDADMELSLESIKYFEPSGEPDVPFDAIREYI
jgi:hypothetical protein